MRRVLVMDDKVSHALSLKKKGNYRAAIALFEEAIEKQGETPFLLSNLGHCLLLAGELKQARSLLEESIRRDPKNTFALSFLAGIAEREDNPKEQIELLSEAIALSPNDVTLRVKIVWALIKGGRKKKAIPHAEWLIARAKDNPVALKAAAVAFRMTDKGDEAHAALKQIVKLNPNDGFAARELIEMGGQGEKDRLAEIERLLKLPANKTNRELLFARIKLLEQLGEVSRAIAAASETAKMFHDDAKVQAAYAQLLVRTYRYRDAMPIIGKLLKSSPGDYYLHNALGRAAREGGLLDEAYGIYTDIICLHPADKRLLGRRRHIQRIMETSAIDPAFTKSHQTWEADRTRLKDSLKKHFGFAEFRPGQEDVICAILSGRHTLAVMPTGRGKSLCFQLPGLMQEGLTIVVSPLIALMKDQVDELTRRSIPAAAINSSLPPDKQDEVIAKTVGGTLRFLYVAPERFKVTSFMEALPRLSPKLFVVDEAHCISQWGHDFRPDYLRLSKAISASGARQVVAMTATATPDVQRDIVKQLKVEGMATFIAGFERPNLAFAVTPISGDSERAERLLELFRKTEGPAIVYAASRKSAEEAGSILSSAGVASRVYHAGLEHDERISVQEAFMKGEIRAIAATNAFGMGIDKADIRLVVHYQMPGSIEAYYQEAGRAGRDGRPSRCELLFSFADKRIQEFFIDGSNPTPEVIRGVYQELLNRKSDVVEVSARAIAAEIDGASDMMVASAISILERMDIIDRRLAGSSLGRIAVHETFLMRPPPDRAAVRHKLWQWIRVETGGGDRPSIEVSPDTISRELSLDAEQVSRGLRALADDGLISYRPPFRGRAVVIRRRMNSNELPIDCEALAEKRLKDEAKLNAMVGYAKSRACRQMHLIRYFGGRSSACDHCDLCRGEKPKCTPSMQLQRRRPPSCEGKISGDDPVFEKLRQWRLDRSQRDDIPPFIVASDRALRAVASARPSNLEELGICFGFGQVKLGRYGEEILKVIRKVV